MELTDYQKKLFPYAYNILGSYDDAKDAVQDVVVRHLLSDHTHIDNESNYLIRSVINQSINIKKRGSKTLNSKIRLPEPISTDNADSGIVSKDILSYSVLVLLDKLNPKERAVFILKEAFDYSHEEIADTLQTSVENSRKMLSRAKSKLGEMSNKKDSAPFYSTRQLEDYITAIQAGNVKSLEQMLTHDISVMTDGGNKSIVASYLEGSDNVIKLVTYVYKEYQSSTTIRISTVNHQPALLFYLDRELINCQIFDILPESGMIRGIYSMVDPEKLKNLAKSY